MSNDRRSPGSDKAQRSDDLCRGMPAAQKNSKLGTAISYCPNCSAELRDHRCKLSCPRCGYFLSCSDFY
jgi:ribosomal protein S27AE